MNLFRYCGDDPIGGSDPTGLSDISYVPSWDTVNRIGVWYRGTEKGIIIVSAHGKPEYMVYRNVTREVWERSHKTPVPVSMRLPASQVVKDIKAHPKYNPTIPVKLDVCYAGKNGRHSQAQQVADGLRTNPVTANPGLVNSWDGKGYGGPDIPFYGPDYDPKTAAPTNPDSNTPASRRPASSETTLGSGGRESGQRVFDAYGSTTPHAAEWERSWGPGGWIAVNRN